jgi:hypothetical protein
MCTTIFINDSDSCETVGEMKAKLNVFDEQIVENIGYLSASSFDCLCCIDIPATLQNANIPFTTDGVDYFVTKK